MKKIIALLTLLLFVCSDVNAKIQCKKCGGGGKMQTRFAMSTFGLDNRKLQCPYCKEWILASETHWDPCDRCGGTGKVEELWSRKENNG